MREVFSTSVIRNLATTTCTKNQCLSNQKAVSEDFLHMEYSMTTTGYTDNFGHYNN